MHSTYSNYEESDINVFNVRYPINEEYSQRHSCLQDLMMYSNFFYANFMCFMSSTPAMSHKLCYWLQYRQLENIVVRTIAQQLWMQVAETKPPSIKTLTLFCSIKLNNRPQGRGNLTKEVAQLRYSVRTVDNSNNSNY